jgi:MFS family permease
MGIGDLLDGAFKLLKANARTVITVTAIFVVPIQFVIAFFARDLFGGNGFLDALSDPEAAESFADSGTTGQSVATLIGWLATLVVLPFVAGAISRVVGASYLGEELSVGPALRATLRRWWALTSGWFLHFLAEISGFILALALGLAVAASVSEEVGVGLLVFFGLLGIPVSLAAMALFVVTAPAIVMEELGPIRGLRRSAHLVRRRLFAVLGAALLSGLLANVLGSVLGFVPQIAGLVVGTERGGWLLLGLGGALPALVTTPFVAIVATLMYFDARIRQEGLDLEVMATDMARGAVPA